MKKNTNRNKVLTGLSFLGIVYFIFLCSLHLATRRPLWLDEDALLTAFKELTPLKLFGILSYQQAFPRLYFFIIREFSSFFHYTVLSLRALPFMFMLASFALWLKLFRKEEGKGFGYLLFILCWCGSTYMSYYAGEFKQYSAELFFGGVFTYFLIRQKELLKKECLSRANLLTYALLPISVLFSYSAYFFLPLPAYNFLLGRKNKSALTALTLYLGSALAFALISYCFDIRYTYPNNDLSIYWDSYFISTASFPKLMETFFEGLRRIYVQWFWEDRPFTHIMTIFMPFALYYTFYSAGKCFKEDRKQIVSLSTIFLFLLAALFVAGILKIFPFTAARITIYLAPFTFYLIIKSIEMFKARVFYLYAILNFILISTLLTISVWILCGYIKRF